MIELADGAVALMQAGFNVEFVAPSLTTLSVLAVKNNHELLIPVDNSGLNFNSCEQLVDYCDSKVKGSSRKWYDIFRNEQNVFG